MEVKMRTRQDARDHDQHIGLADVDSPEHVGEAFSVRPNSFEDRPWSEKTGDVVYVIGGGMLVVSVILITSLILRHIYLSRNRSRKAKEHAGSVLKSSRTGRRLHNVSGANTDIFASDSDSSSEEKLLLNLADREGHSHVANIMTASNLSFLQNETSVARAIPDPGTQEWRLLLCENTLANKALSKPYALVAPTEIAAAKATSGAKSRNVKWRSDGKAKAGKPECDSWETGWYESGLDDLPFWQFLPHQTHEAGKSVQQRPLLLRGSMFRSPRDDTHESIIARTTAMFQDPGEEADYHAWEEFLKPVHLRNHARIEKELTNTTKYVVKKMLGMKKDSSSGSQADDRSEGSVHRHADGEAVFNPLTGSDMKKRTPRTRSSSIRGSLASRRSSSGGHQRSMSEGRRSIGFQRKHHSNKSSMASSLANNMHDALDAMGVV
ncbi:unnamed protein product [Amoebophrya sp. A25]|nr:unnamed protein product [Amoebophrya sp. A25]|eukprot:GSA25T00008266001.1